MRTEPILVAMLVIAAPACASADSTATSEPMEPSFQNVVEQVLIPKCTFAQCHSDTTGAASLDLTADSACIALVDKPSCLFPDRMRVLPGNPDESFLFHKLAGEGLDEAPAGDCGLGAGHATNQRMPLGASEISEDELVLLRAWIAAGAPCTGKPSQDAGPAIASITADDPAPLAGRLISITVTLDRAAPAGGQMLTFVTDPSLLSTPTQMMVPALATSIRFEAYALRPTSRFTLQVRAARSAKELVLRIAGLEIAEVMSDPIGDDDQLQWIKLRNRSAIELDLTGYRLAAGQDSYDLVTVPLQGLIPPGGCALIGGPIASAANGEPMFSQPVDFTPDLPHGGNRTTGFAVFDDNAVPPGGIATPVDTMLVGATNDAGLLDPSGAIARPSCGTPASGTSALRTGPSSCVAAQMQPSACPPAG